MRPRDETFWIVLRELSLNGPLEFVSRAYDREYAERSAEALAEKDPGRRYFGAEVRIEALLPRAPEVTIRSLETPIPF